MCTVPPQRLNFFYQFERISWISNLTLIHYVLQWYCTSKPTHFIITFEFTLYRRIALHVWDKLAAVLQLSPSIQHLKIGYHVDIIGNLPAFSQLVKLCGKTLKTLHCPVYLLDDDDEPAPNVSPFKQLAHLTDLR